MTPYHYIGTADQWYPGVPARDLTDDEAELWPVVKDSPFYRKRGKAVPEPAPAPAPGAGNDLERGDE